MSLEEDLRVLIRSGDPAGCLARLARADEPARTKAATAMLRTFDDAHALSFRRDTSKAAKRLGVEDTRAHEQIVAAARVALLGTLQRVEPLRKYAWRSIPTADEVIAIVQLRRPEWILEWAELVCELAPNHWTTVRRLVREGLCPKPASDGYVLGMIHTAKRRADSRYTEDGERPLFEDDAELLDDDIWRVFEVEGNRNISLTDGEGFWRVMLLAHAKSGRLDRARMLDATLAALARDFAQHKAGFYSRLHDALAPTAEERAARAATYVELLASRISPTVTLATRAIESLPAEAKLDRGAFARAAVTAARSARGQSTALTLVALLGAASGPDRAESLLAATELLEHSSVEVVDAVLALLEGTNGKASAAIVARVGALAPAVAASRRGRVDAWLRVSGGDVASTSAAPPVAATKKTETTAAPEHLARAGFDALAAAPAMGPWPRVTLDDPNDPAPRLDRDRKVVPVASIAELFATVVRAIEEPNDRVTYERMLDGISRLGAPLAALPVESVKPVAKRAARRRGDVGAARLVHEWLAGEDGKVKGQLLTPSTLNFGRRRVVNVLARLARGETRPLLSLPSTESFFVDPRELVRRVRALGDGAIDIEDAVVALLRLAPEGRRDALADLAEAKGALAAVVRHALGGKEKIPGKAPKALWLAAARARCPGADDPRVMRAFPDAGPDGGEAVRPTFVWARSDYTDSYSKKTTSGGRVELRVAPASPPKLMGDEPSVLLATPGNDAQSTGAIFGVEADVRELAATFPLDRRSFLARGAVRIARNIDWSSVEWANHVFLEPLLDPDVALDGPALVLLAAALNAKEARENALATDALIAAISDGRIVGPELGAPMAWFWDPLHEEVTYSRRPTAGRWTKTLSAVTRVSALHAEVVRRLLESFAAAAPAAPPADVNALLQLWLDLAVEAKCGVPEPARAALSVLGKSGKAKAVATKLLALPSAPSVLAAEAHALAVDGRRQRAARWTRYGSGVSATSRRSPSV